MRRQKFDPEKNVIDLWFLEFVSMVGGGLGIPILIYVLRYGLRFS